MDIFIFFEIKESKVSMNQDKQQTKRLETLKKNLKLYHTPLDSKKKSIKNGKKVLRKGYVEICRKLRKSYHCKVPETYQHVNQCHHRKSILIDVPGAYKLSKDFHFIPNSKSTTPTAAIYITANNVTLDLNGWTVQQIKHHSVPVDGICVMAENVRIINGTVRDFSRSGIRTQGSDIIKLDNMTLINNGNGQVFDDDFGIGGLITIDTRTIQVNNSLFVNNVFIGLGGDGVKNVIIENVQVNNTRGLSTPTIFGHVAFGIMFSIQNLPPLNQTTAENNITVRKSTINGTHAGDSSFGAALGTLAVFGEPRSNSVLVEDVTINDSESTNTVTDVPLGTFTFGLVSFADSVVFRHVKVSHAFNHSPVTSSGIPNASQIQGIEGSGNNGLLVENCQSANHVGSSNGQPLAAFDVEGPLENLVIRNNVVQNVHSLDGPARMPGVGFLITERTGESLFDVIAPGITVQDNTAQGISDFGFWIEGIRGGFIENNVSINNGSVGFLFDDSLPNVESSGVVVQNNKAISNGTVGFINMHPEDSRFSFIQNLSRSNPINYSDIPINSIVIYDPPNPPPVTPSIFLNLSITPGIIA